jgi:methionyl-tRNA formyltransferase
MILRGIVLLASDTARTKSYLQAMIRNDMIPERCIVYSDHSEKMEEDAAGYQEKPVKSKYFELDEPVLFSIKKAGIPYELVDDKDINSERMKTEIQSCDAPYLIYSGYGGYILKPHLFQLGKKFIHVHAGILPMYRGSTTVYYSFLAEHKIGATAIFLDEKIDNGDIIVQREFDIPEEKVDVDYIYEPFTRSQVLMDAMRMYAQNGKFSSRQQDKENAETYFIIHPLLKHIAMLEIEQMQSEI